MSNIVLVHGAFHGGWCWRDVAARLRTDGHQVFTPTLTGLGERSHLLSAAVDLDTHIDDVVNVIEWEELNEVVLVGHSYGGMPVTGAADRMPARIAALVYLDAYAPEDGENVRDSRSSGPGAVPLREPEDGIGVAPPPSTVFGVDGALAAWTDRRLTAQPHATTVQPIRLTGAWRGVAKKIYIRCRQYPHPALDRYLATAQAADDWVALADDWPHNIMMTDPDWFVSVLRQHAL